MKISEFASLHQVSPDTVRYYVREGLLYPIRDGYHFQFDERCSADLRRIQNLKAAGFSLSDIRRIILSSQDSPFSAKESASTVQDIYQKRLAEISQEIERLTGARRYIEDCLSSPSCPAERTQVRPFGVPLSALSLLSCPCCHGSLELESNQIEAGQIINGSFTCSQCEHVFPIKDGILFLSPAEAAHRNFSSFDRFWDQSNTALMQAIYQNVRWMKSRISQTHRPVRTYLEAGSGFGFFLRYTYDLLGDHALYIAVDHDPMRHQVLKNVLAARPEKKQVVLLCCDYTSIPLKSGSIDQIIDFGGSNDYSWTTPGFLMDILDHFTHERSSALYLNRSYDRIPFDSSIDLSCRKYLYEEPILENFKKLGYKVREKLRMEFTQHLKATNAFMNDKDQIYRLWLYLEKSASH